MLVLAEDSLGADNVIFDILVPQSCVLEYEYVGEREEERKEDAISAEPETSGDRNRE